MIDPHRALRIEQDSGATVLVDGGNNFGAYVGLCALDLAIERARRNGACVLGVKGSNHYGTGAFYASRAVQQGMVLIAASNASQTRSEEHTSERQSLMRISYAVFCLNKKKSSIKITAPN